METIKISVEVNITLSNSTQEFIKSLFNSKSCACTQAKPVQAPAAQAKPAQAPAAQAPAAQAPAAQAPVAPAPAAQAPAAQAPVAPVKPAQALAAQAKPAQDKLAQETPTHTVDDVRKKLSEKISGNRVVIKEKLESFGAPSVTSLSPHYYDEMYDFLNSL